MAVSDEDDTFLVWAFTWIRAILQFLAFFLYGLVYEKDHVLNSNLPPITNEILTLPATVLAAKIRNKELKSEDVVKAFIKRIKEVNGVLNFLVDSRYKEALKDAKEVDNQISRMSAVDLEGVREHKPFLGVPFTTKDNIGVAGMLLTGGLLSRAEKKVKAESDAEVVKRMKEAGGIPLATTNIPELGMAFETYSVKFGRTKNPYHPGRIAGGSSGGEGCAISSASSVIGIGSDVGGSIRMPAFFNGIFGHKATSGTSSNEGSYPPATVGPVCDEYLLSGPMCRYATDLLPMLKVLTNPEAAALLKLNSPLPNPKRLRILYMTEIYGTLMETTVHRSLLSVQRRVIMELDRKLKLHPELINLSPAFKNAFNMWDNMMSLDKSRPSFKLQMAGGGDKPVRPIVELCRWLVGFGYGPWTRHTFAAISYALLEDLKETFLLKRKPEEKEELKKDVEKLRAELDSLLGDDGVLIFQSHPTPAPYHGMSCLPLAFNFSYTAIFNVLGNPVCQVPVGMGLWGVPLGVQIVAARHKDVNCISMALAIEKLFGGWNPPTPIKLPERT